jgi:two-component system OmpR family sensor kinase
VTERLTGSSVPPDYLVAIEVPLNEVPLNEVPLNEVPLNEVLAGDAIDPNAQPPAPVWLPPASPSADVFGGAVPPSYGPPESLDLLEPDRPAESGRRHRWKLLPRTLRWRLVTGVAVLILFVLGVTGAVTYITLGSFLTNRLDQQLNGIADTNRGNTTIRCNTSDGVNIACSIGFGKFGSSTPSSPALRGATKLWFAILDGQGGVVTPAMDNPDLPVMTLTRAQFAAIQSAPQAVRSLTTTGGQSLRVTARTVQAVAAPGVTLSGVTFVEISGLSTDEKTNTLTTLLRLELLIGGGAVLVGALLTSVGVQLSLRPLNRVTNTARAVTAELSPEGAGLDRRVPVTETDTEVGRLAESVNTLLGAVETQFTARVESDQRMRQFMADASHELRTPLTSIRGYAELARMRRALDGDDTSSDGDADAFGRIESEGTRMSRLIDDLLTLARGDIGAPIQSEPVDIAELVDDAVEGAQASYPDRHFGATSFPGIVASGDHDELLRVVRNLVTNAAVHTAPGGPIRVNATLEGGQAIISVIDSGPGLPPEQAAQVFERFWRSDTSRARTSGGSGLGLAIVASIVAAHGGTVRFDSSVEAGSTVTVSLPAR